MMRAILPLLALFLCFTGLPACSGTWSFTRGVVYERTAEANYRKGLAELQDDNHLEALKLFNHVKNKFPFSRFATLAELRIADTYFAQEKWADAVDAYRQFIKFHPTHPDVTGGYAAYRVCDSYVHQIPGDWFLIPPGYEKDQAATHDALRELQAFERTYKKSKYLADVHKLRKKCVRRVVDHELYVARFYLKREHPKATTMRLETLLASYPGEGADPEVMLLLGRTYMQMDQKDKAQKAFTDLVARYPKDPYAQKARLYLDFLHKKAR